MSNCAGGYDREVGHGKGMLVALYVDNKPKVLGHLRPDRFNGYVWTQISKKANATASKEQRQVFYDNTESFAKLFDNMERNVNAPHSVLR